MHPVVDPSVRELCPRPYPGHRKGCPNYGQRSSCPPKARLIGDVLNLDATVYCAWNVFPLGRHVARMREKHPDWSERQLECCLYWQGTARKHLNERIVRFLDEQNDRLVVLRCPEACGVNVTATMALLGVVLEWSPKRLAVQVALIGQAARRPCSSVDRAPVF